MKKLLLLTIAGTMLAACGAKNSGTSTTAPTPAAETPSAATSPPTSTDVNKATQESAGAAVSGGDASLEGIVAMPDNVQLPDGKWKAGTNYKPIVPAQTTSAEPGQVEVIEFMWLGCPHCYDLQSSIEAWSKQKPPYVKFLQEHVMWGPAHRAHGKLLYTLLALNRPDLIRKAFDEIHLRKNNLLSLKGDDAETRAMHIAFAKANGLNEADFKREYDSFGVNTRLQHAEELTRRYRVESVPLIVVNGKYMTDVSMAGGKTQLLQLINDLAAAEKGR